MSAEFDLRAERPGRVFVHGEPVADMSTDELLRRIRDAAGSGSTVLGALFIELDQRLSGGGAHPQAWHRT